MFCPPPRNYRGKEGGGCRPARQGELGCFHQKQPSSGGTSWKAKWAWLLFAPPFLLNTPLAFFCCLFFRNVTETYEFRNDTYFLSVMLRNLTDYVIIPFWPSGMLRIFTNCAFTLPFNFWHVTKIHGLCNDAFFNFRHVTELHELPNDGCQVPRSGQTRVASQQRMVPVRN